MGNTAELQKIVNEFEKSGINANVYVTANKKRVKANIPFSLVFTSVVRMLAKEHNFSKTDYDVLFCIADQMSIGNSMGVSQQAIANELGINRVQVTRCFGKFRKIGLIIKDENGYEYLNPFCISKGTLDRFKDNDELYSLAQQMINSNNLEETPF